MREMSKDEKIVFLERFLRAIVGRPDAEITYRRHDMLNPAILIECDIDDVIKNGSNLRMNDIEITFYPRGKIEKYPWEKKSHLTGITEVEFMFEPQYWIRVEKLEKELKELKAKNNESAKV